MKGILLVTLHMLQMISLPFLRFAVGHNLVLCWALLCVKDGTGGYTTNDEGENFASLLVTIPHVAHQNQWQVDVSSVPSVYRE